MNVFSENRDVPLGG